MFAPTPALETLGVSHQIAKLKLGRAIHTAVVQGQGLPGVCFQGWAAVLPIFYAAGKEYKA